MLDQAPIASSNVVRGPIDGTISQEIERQIDAHVRHDARLSKLTWLTNSLWREDENSLMELRRLKEKVVDNEESSNESDLTKLRSDAVQLIEADNRALALQDEIDHYATGLLKTASMFVPGKVGLALTIGTSALDASSCNDTVENQFIDLSLGGLKGALTIGIFKGLGAAELRVAANATVLGTATRLLDLGLDRHTYVDHNSKSVNLKSGLTKTFNTALSNGALLTDVFLFGAAHGLFYGVDWLTQGALATDTFMRTIFSGATFGVTTGAAFEITRECAAHEKFCFSKILSRAAFQGVVDGIAAVPGGLALNRSSVALSQLLNRPERTMANSLRLDTVAKDGQETDCFGDSSVRLRGYSRRHVIFRVGLKDQGPYSSYNDLEYRGQAIVNSLMRFYNVEGYPDTKIAVTDSDARRYGQLKVIEFLRANDAETILSKLDASKKVLLKSLVDSAAQLGTHPLYGRLSLENASQLLPTVPDPRYIKTLYLINKPHPDQAWIQQLEGSSELKVLGEAKIENDAGEIWLFEPEADVVPTFRHEWAHIAEFKFPELFELFKAAGTLEHQNLRHRVMWSDEQTQKEAWAEMFGEQILANDQEKVEQTLKQSPIKSSILGKCLSEILRDLPYRYHGPQYEQFRRLSQRIDTSVLPEARAKLIACVGTSERAQQQMALKLLGHLGSDSELPFLKKIVSSSNDRTLSELAFDAMLQICRDDVHRQLELARWVANSRSLARVRAFRKLDAIGNRRQPQP